MLGFRAINRGRAPGIHDQVSLQLWPVAAEQDSQEAMRCPLNAHAAAALSASVAPPLSLPLLAPSPAALLPRGRVAHRLDVGLHSVRGRWQKRGAQARLRRTGNVPSRLQGCGLEAASTATPPIRPRPRLVLEGAQPGRQHRQAHVRAPSLRQHLRKQDPGRGLQSSVQRQERMAQVG